MIVQPVSQPGGVRALTPGEAVTFRWRSDSSKWTNYKECRLYSRWEIRVGPVAGAANGAALTRGALPPNLRLSGACPNGVCRAPGAANLHHPCARDLSACMAAGPPRGPPTAARFSSHSETERINFAVDFRCGFPMYLYHSEIMKSTAKLIRSV